MQIDTIARDQMKKFNKGLQDLLTEYNVALVAVPFLMQNKNGGFEIHCKIQAIDVSAKVEAESKLSEG